MTQFDIRQTTTTSLKSGVPETSVTAKQTDGPQLNQENTWTFSNFAKWYGYYLSIPELKKAIQTHATWVVGQGFTTDDNSQVLLDNIIGSGEDDILSIFWNMMVMKKVNGDSFAEIIRNPKTGTLINLKPLSPQNIKITFSKKGIITKYTDMRSSKDFKPNEMFHLVNDRVADEMHGDSVVETMQWLIDARKEAMEDWRRISHRSTIRVLYIDEDNPTKLNIMREQYKKAIKDGEVLILPGKPGEKSFQDLNLPPVEAFLTWIRYLENAFYKGVGTPKTLAGDAEGIPESGGKMVVLTHEPTYLREVTALEADIWNQLAIKVEFKKQTSLADQKGNDEKNTNQIQATQPSDTNVGGI